MLLLLCDNQAQGVQIMAKLNDLTGKTFGQWYVLSRSGSTKNKASKWLCKCMSCGTTKEVVGQTLTNGSSTMCRSCSAKIYSKKSKYSGDKLKTSLYAGIKQRCYNPNHEGYKYYGARGIKMCDEWKDNSDSFCEWAYANGYKAGMSIERIDTDGNYEPDNCTFIPIEEQPKNRRTTHFITIGDRTLTYSDWCRLFDVDYHTVNRIRSKYNCSPKDALLVFLSQKFLD